MYKAHSSARTKPTQVHWRRRAWFNACGNHNTLVCCSVSLYSSVCFCASPTGCTTHIVWSRGGISILKMAPPSIFYHYTSKDNLEGILATNTIFCSTPHPATPGLLGGYVIKSGVFLTRMDPNNSKAAIAFNNYRWQHSQPLEGSKIA